MSIILFAAILGITAFGLACLTDWLLNDMDPFVTAGQPYTPRPVSRYRAVKNPIRRLRKVRKVPYNTEIRELPFLC